MPKLLKHPLHGSEIEPRWARADGVDPQHFAPGQHLGDEMLGA